MFFETIDWNRTLTFFCVFFGFLSFLVGCRQQTAAPTVRRKVPKIHNVRNVREDKKEERSREIQKTQEISLAPEKTANGDVEDSKNVETAKTLEEPPSIGTNVKGKKKETFKPLNFKAPGTVKKADAKDPQYETLGQLDNDIFKNEQDPGFK